jgi:hypothetical protein
VIAKTIFIARICVDDAGSRELICVVVDSRSNEPTNPKIEKNHGLVLRCRHVKEIKTNVHG